MDWPAMWQTVCEYITTPEYQGAMATGSILTTVLGFAWRRLWRKKADTIRLSAERLAAPTFTTAPVYVKTHDGTEIKIG